MEMVPTTSCMVWDMVYTHPTIYGDPRKLQGVTKTIGDLDTVYGT